MRTTDLLACLLSALVATATAQATVGTEVTYQGRLLDAGEPAAGPVDLAFRLYDAPAGGNQVGPELVALGFVDFDDAGLFTIDLDFGTVFDGAALFLEIDVDD